MRPTYETASDRSKQDHVKVVLEEAWKVRLLPTPPKHVFDFVMLRGVMVKGFIEYKRRKGFFGCYPDTILSAKKLTGVNAFAPIPAYFVVQWDDQMVYTKLRPEMWQASEWGGRTLKMRDSQDIEVIAKIENKEFANIGARL